MGGSHESDSWVSHAKFNQKLHHIKIFDVTCKFYICLIINDQNIPQCLISEKGDEKKLLLIFFLKDQQATNNAYKRLNPFSFEHTKQCLESKCQSASLTVS